jgi:hypothetical protein
MALLAMSQHRDMSVSTVEEFAVPQEDDSPRQGTPMRTWKLPSTTEAMQAGSRAQASSMAQASACWPVWWSIWDRAVLPRPRSRS